MNTPSAAYAAALLGCALLACPSISTASNIDVRPDSHAPISVMGDHSHNKGELMLSYRYMQMSMRGNRDGSKDISPQDIASTVPNRFASLPMMPPTLRVVPTEMTMSMHMLGLMYAPSDLVTLMGMVNYTRKEMDHITFMGPSGTNELGRFTTETSGFGDTSLSALLSLPNDRAKHWQLELGVSLPTGSTDETDAILTPMNTRPSPRLPYPMQLGSGTYDLIAGVTYSRHAGQWGFGAQWRSVFRLDENDEGYTLGDEHRVQSWLSYLAHPLLSVSGRFAYYDRGNIDGIDSQIRAPVQTANPDFQAAQRLDFGLGANFLVPGDRHRISFEFSAPLTQHLDGPQMETDWTVTLGWQFTP